MTYIFTAIAVAFAIAFWPWIIALSLLAGAGFLLGMLFGSATLACGLALLFVAIAFNLMAQSWDP